MADAPALIRFRDVTLGYGRTPVLSGLDFEIRENDFLGLVGPNGAGKTTILRAVLGTLKPMSGRVERGSPQLRFGYVPQRSSLDYGWPWRTVEIVEMGRYDRVGLFRRPGVADREAALRALAQAGIEDLARRRFGSLSGGQKQRALIARALVGQPNVLILDEPTEGMDLVSAAAILRLVRRLHDEEGLTVLMVSHALNEVANFVRRLALVLEGAFQIGDVEDVLTEANLAAMYGIPVEVDRIGSRRIVLPGEIGSPSRAEVAEG